MEMLLLLLAAAPALLAGKAVDEHADKGLHLHRHVPAVRASVPKWNQFACKQDGRA